MIKIKNLKVIKYQMDSLKSKETRNKILVLINTRLKILARDNFKKA